MGKCVKNLRLVLFGILCIGLLTTCEQRRDLTPFTAPATLPKENVVAPEIVAVSIPDVPSRNILVDTVTNTIQVTLPENYSIINPTLSFTFSCTSCTLPDQSRSFSLQLAHIGSASPVVSRPIYAVAQNASSSLYTLSIKPTGLFAVLAGSNPVAVEVGSYEFPGLEVRNFLDLQYTEALLTNTETGIQLKTFADFERSAPPFIPPRYDRIYVRTNGLLPGLYDVTLTKADGRQVTVPRAIVVVKGKPVVTGVQWAMANEALVLVQGVNLYAEFNPELVLATRKGDVVRLPISAFNEQKREAFIRIPTSVPPGSYSARVVSAKGESALTSKVQVLRYANQPILLDLRIGSAENSDLQTLSLLTPYRLSMSSISLVRKDRLVFTPLNAGNGAFEIPITIPESYYLAGPDGGGTPMFTLPASTPAGRYQISLRVYDTETTYRDSEPLDQEFVIH
ncbi:hypothetical protein [Fibrella arboris]|uniref:hypothetical protein n=1 Tax=Fibrella arboris TaxID=3242486 RepID=UPI00351FD475